jgi:hypothetical protein
VRGRVRRSDGGMLVFLMRSFAAIAGLLFLSVLAVGCAARPRGAARETATRDATGRPRDGWARLGPGVRLRDDTPSLSTVLPPEPPPAPPTEYGPRGATGDVSQPWETTLYSPGYGSMYGQLPWAPFLLPGGALLPGLRPPSDVATGPFAQPFLTTFPASDVATHRPGLSTGSGIFGRQDNEPVLPAPPIAPAPHR